MRIYNWLRIHVTSPLPSRLQFYLYLGLMPFFLAKRTLHNALRRGKDTQTWREKMQALFDFFSPIYQNRHEPAQVQEWYSKEGFIGVEVSVAGPYGFGVLGYAPGRAQAAEAVARGSHREE